MMSAGHVGGTHASVIVSSAADVLGMSVVRGMRGVGGVCEMCMCLARCAGGGEEGEWMRGLGLSFTNPVVTWGVLDVCLCLGCGDVGGVDGVWVGGLDQGLEGWGRVMSVCVVTPDSLCRWQIQVSVYCARRIPADLKCTQCSILFLWISASYHVFVYDIYRKYRLVCVRSSDLDLSRHHPLL